MKSLCVVLALVLSAACVWAGPSNGRGMSAPEPTAAADTKTASTLDSTAAKASAETAAQKKKFQPYATQPKPAAASKATKAPKLSAKEQKKASERAERAAKISQSESADVKPATAVAAAKAPAPRAIPAQRTPPASAAKSSEVPTKTLAAATTVSDAAPAPSVPAIPAPADVAMPKPVTFAVTVDAKRLATPSSKITTTTEKKKIFEVTRPPVVAKKSDDRTFSVTPSSVAPSKLERFTVADGWEASVVAHSGQRMSDGLTRPGYPAGLACVAGDKNELIVMSAHRVPAEAMAASPWGLWGVIEGRASVELVYQSTPRPGTAGVTRMVVDEDTGSLKRQELVLAGTLQNAAAAVTPWGTALSGETDVTDPKLQAGTPTRIIKDEQNIPADYGAPSHGWVFEVPARGRGLAAPVPLADMGRFYHSGIACDPVAGVVYLAEDMPDGLLYRYTPKVWGNLAAGGKLEALVVVGQPTADMRNWKESPRKLEVGKSVPYTWVSLDDVTSPKNDLRWRGARAGAATFARGKGIAYKNGRVIFAVTSGGLAQLGQLWEIRGDRLVLLDETTGAEKGAVNPDSLTILDDGSILVGEGRLDGGQPRLMRRSIEGVWSLFFANNTNKSGIGGVVASPNERLVFLNIEAEGVTLVLKKK